MRLLKLVAMGLAGYAIYELGRTLTQMGGVGGMDAPASGDAASRPSPAQQADIHRRVLSGSGGEGMAVEVHDPSGATRQQVVGRGIVHR